MLRPFVHPFVVIVLGIVLGMLFLESFFLDVIPGADPCCSVDLMWDPAGFFLIAVAAMWLTGRHKVFGVAVLAALAAAGLSLHKNLLDHDLDPAGVSLRELFYLATEFAIMVMVIMLATGLIALAGRAKDAIVFWGGQLLRLMALGGFGGVFLLQVWPWVFNGSVLPGWIAFPVSLLNIGVELLLILLFVLAFWNEAIALPEERRGRAYGRRGGRRSRQDRSSAYV